MVTRAQGGNGPARAAVEGGQPAPHLGVAGLAEHSQPEPEPGCVRTGAVGGGAADPGMPRPPEIGGKGGTSSSVVAPLGGVAPLLDEAAAARPVT